MLRSNSRAAMRARTRAIVLEALIGILAMIALCGACRSVVFFHPLTISTFGMSDPVPGGWRVRIATSPFGYTRIVSQSCPDWPRITSDWRDPIATRIVRVPYWSTATQPIADQSLLDGRRVLTVIEDSLGWPMRCLMCRWVVDRGEIILHGGIEVIPDNTVVGDFGAVASDLDYWASGASPVALPMDPILLGVAGNLVSWWFIVHVMKRVLYGMIHFVRRKRGQCTWCGYSLTGLDSDRCPECGGRRSGSA